MPERFPNLYDLDRWRRYGYPLLGLAVVGLVAGTILEVRHSPTPANDWLVLAAAGLGLASSLWLRQRYSFVRLEGEQLLFRVLTVSVRVDLAEVRRARVGRLAPLLERRARPPRRLAGSEALVLRLRQGDGVRLRRLLSRRCVFDDEVVVPLGNAAQLHRQIEAALAPQRRAQEQDGHASASRHRARRGRRR